ncbi:hypothetical protein BHE74_00031916 [Ensete ventricosum]|nr:hypothetical protein BHE74_00031916 [Ensete ventricosum]
MHPKDSKLTSTFSRSEKPRHTSEPWHTKRSWQNFTTIEARWLRTRKVLTE